MAIGIAARALDYGILFDFRDSRIYGDPEGDITVRIRPQVPVGEYCVDFVVSMRIIEGSDNDFKVYTATTVVECDGFKFHDATRESATKDRERDRDIQALGMPILRFAGSEIWADVFTCAGAVLFLMERAKTERVAAARKPPSAERRHSMGEAATR